MKRYGTASVLALGLAVAVCAFALASILYLRHAATSNAETDLRNLGRAIAGQSEAALTDAEAAVSFVRDWLESHPRASAEEIQALLDREATAAQPYVRVMSVYDADGILRHVSKQPPPAMPVSFADRPWFIATKRESGRGLRIGDPIRSKLNDLWLVPLSLRVEAGDRGFAGAVAASLDPIFFENYFRVFDLGGSAAITLQRGDSMVLARRPFSDSLIGKTFPEGPIFRVMQAQEEGIVRAVSQVDGSERLIYGRWVGRYPVYVAISITIDASLAGWRTQAAIVSTSSLALLALIGVLYLSVARMNAQIAAREMAERQMRLARDEAESANRAKTIFLANMSHELRTPLNAIIGFSDLMAHEPFGPLAGKYKEYVEDIKSSGEHLLALIGDMLDLARLDAGKMELREENVDLGRLVRRAWTMVQPSAERLKTAIALDLPGDLPQLYGDPLRIEQMILNLMSNAIKFSPGGEVRVTARHAEGRLEIDVTDNGIGMDEADAALAMTPFGQAVQPGKTRPDGAGLGLPLVKSLVELHGGALEIQSAKGKGTRARLTFPGERIRQ